MTDDFEQRIREAGHNLADRALVPSGGALDAISRGTRRTRVQRTIAASCTVVAAVVGLGVFGWIAGSTGGSDVDPQIAVDVLDITATPNPATSVPAVEDAPDPSPIPADTTDPRAGLDDNGGQSATSVPVTAAPDETPNSSGLQIFPDGFDPAVAAGIATSTPTAVNSDTTPNPTTRATPDPNGTASVPPPSVPPTAPTATATPDGSGPANPIATTRPTATADRPSASSTPVPNRPTATPSPRPTGAPTATRVPTSTPAPTPTAIPADGSNNSGPPGSPVTPVASATSTGTTTPTTVPGFAPTATPTVTPSPTATVEGSPPTSVTPTSTPTAEPNKGTATPTQTPDPSPTPDTSTPTATATPSEATPTPTSEPGQTPTPTPSATPESSSSTPTPTPTPTTGIDPSPTSTPTPTATTTPTPTATVVSVPDPSTAPPPPGSVACDTTFDGRPNHPCAPDSDQSGTCPSSVQDPGYPAGIPCQVVRAWACSPIDLVDESLYLSVDTDGDGSRDWCIAIW